MVDTFGEYTIETTKNSRKQTTYTVSKGEVVICRLEQRGSGQVERHIVPEQRDQFRKFLRQWRNTNGYQHPFTY